MKWLGVVMVGLCLFSCGDPEEVPDSGRDGSTGDGSTRDAPAVDTGDGEDAADGSAPDAPAGDVPGPGGELGICCPVTLTFLGCGGSPVGTTGGWARSMESCMPTSTDTEWREGVDEWGCDTLEQTERCCLCDAGPPDAGFDAGDEGIDAGVDASEEPDAGSRSTLVPGFCPSAVTAPGLYRGTLASNLNDIATASCVGATPGRDGAVRIELAPGETVRATYRHAGDGVLYLLDSCPVTSSCLVGSDDASSGAEAIEWTNDGAETNAVYVVLDSAALDGPQTFELDLFVSGS